MFNASNLAGADAPSSGALAAPCAAPRAATVSAPVPADPPLVVMKFGSSVLRGPSDVSKAVSEVYRRSREGAKVIAVVSALEGHTNTLLDEARDHGCAHDNRYAPNLAAVGEARASALVAMACERVGLRAGLMGPEAMKFRADGPRDDAEPVSLDAGAVKAALQDADVVVAPGFVALDAHGAPVLLGRGGTDLSAVFIAAECGADEVCLIKDVPGVFTADPAIVGDKARLYPAISWSDARKIAGKLVQARALDVAAARGVTVHVAAANARAGTRIAGRTDPPARAPRPEKLRVALAGCGVVGAGVAQHLLRAPDAFEVVGVLVRDVAKPRDVALDPALYVDDPDTLFAARPDVVVDVLSSGEAGLALSERALAEGIDVVSANKQAVVSGLERLQALAAASGASLGDAATVGGGCPMLEAVRADAAAPERVEAVLNGTVNFVLGRLAQGASLDDALGEARAAGFAEEDPSADLDGHDAAAKIRLLAHAAYGVAPDDADTPREPLDRAAAERIAASGQAWKQVGETWRDADGRVRAAVRLVPADALHPVLAATVREENALRAVRPNGADTVVRGRGAGRWPTSEAVFADLVDVRAKRLEA